MSEETATPPNTGSSLQPLRGADPKTILARYLSEESTKDIAESYGVTRQALGQWLMRHAEEDWKQAQVARALARKEEAEDNLAQVKAIIDGFDKENLYVESARANISLAHAREALKSAQWDLERVCRRIYGQDVTPDQLGRVSITLNIGSREPLDVVGEQGKDALEQK